MANKPARGNALQVGWRPERSPGVPTVIGTAFEWLLARLPFQMDLTRTEEAAGQVNKSGFTERGVPGFITGDGTSFSHPFVVPHLLPFLQHILGSSVANGTLVKTTLEAGPPAVFQYVLNPDPNGVDQTQEWLTGHPPVANGLRRLVKWSELVAAITGAGEIPVTLNGFCGHESDLSQGEPLAANTGTYDLGPHVRGPLLDPSAGDIWVQISAVGPPMQIKIIQSPTEPTGPDWTAATAQDVVTDADGEGLWQVALDDALLDLGIYTSENKDPFEIILPGLDADRANAAIGDTYRFRVTWDLPAPTYLASGGRRMGMPHWSSFLRPAGAGVWNEVDFQQMTLTLGWPLTVDQGSGSRYYRDLDRDGQLLPVFAVQRSWVNQDFRDFARAHERFEIEQRMRGVQLGTGQHRESLDITAPYVGTRSRTKDSPVGRITESMELIAEGGPNGEAPLTITVITDRDWTPAT